MYNIIKITEYEASELDIYARLTGAQLRNKLEPEQAIFIAESPTVIEVALSAGCVPLSLLTEERLINSSVANIIESCSRMQSDNPNGFPVYTADRELLKRITGFELTRGALCAMKRPSLPSVKEVCRQARTVAVLEEITDSTNIGAIIRSAAALNIDAVLVTPTSCDPFCRRAIRVSMGTVFLVPIAKIGEGAEDWPAAIDELRELGFKTCAMALTDDSVSIDDRTLLSEEKLAIILGTEGTGLKKETISACDYTVKIPMSHGVDSLNVAAAGTIAFWQLGKR